MAMKTLTQLVLIQSDAVWGDARFVTPRSVDVYVRRIREKIEPDPENPRYLKTVRGAGYRFEAPK